LVEQLSLPVDRVSLVEFMDFQCPPCKAAYPGIRNFLKSHPNVNYVPVNFPLSFHVHAFEAAVAYELSKTHNQEEKVFQDLMTGKVALDAHSLNSYLEQRRLRGDVGSTRAHAAEQRVRDDLKLAKDLGVSGTPTFFIVSRAGTVTQAGSFRDLEELVK
jgi:protein-disulfide isomerase